MPSSSEGWKSLVERKVPGDWSLGTITNYGANPDAFGPWILTRYFAKFGVNAEVDGDGIIALMKLTAEEIAQIQAGEHEIIRKEDLGEYDWRKFKYFLAECLHVKSTYIQTGPEITIDFI